MRHVKHDQNLLLIEFLRWANDHHCAFRSLLQGLPAPAPPPPPAGESGSPCPPGDNAQLPIKFKCPECEAQGIETDFPSNKALQTHRFRAHAHRNFAQFYVERSKCPICSQDYGSRPRAVHHVSRASVKCKRAILAGQAPKLPPARVDELIFQDRPIFKEARKLGVSALRASTPGPRSGPKRGH